MVNFHVIKGRWAKIMATTHTKNYLSFQTPRDIPGMNVIGVVPFVDFCS